jgi:long-subunit fatty acid transport protein
MMKRLLLCLFCICAFTTTQAQDSLHIKQQVSAPYKVAVGMRYAFGGQTGGDLGISAKYFVGKQSALEAYSNLSMESRFFLASLSYIWQPKLATSERFRPYTGIGIGLLRTKNHAPWHFDGPASYTNPVGVFSLGVEYSLKKIPLAISLDYRSTFVRYGRSTPNYVNLNNSSNIGLGLKYTFR